MVQVKQTPDAASDVCAGCGLVVPNGTAGCQAIYNELLVLDYSNPAYGRLHRLKVDTYCLQHPDRYCVSAKSLAAHLTGLCCAFEHRGDPAVPKALQRWLSTNPSLEKPELPSSRGVVTIADVHAATDLEAHARAAERWARSTWEAYSVLHPLARRWLRDGLACGSNPVPHRRSRPLPAS